MGLNCTLILSSFCSIWECCHFVEFISTFWHIACTVTESKEPVEGIAPLNNEEIDYIKIVKIIKTCYIIQ